MSDPSTSEIEETVRKFLFDRGCLDEGEEISSTESLLRRGVIDSFTMVELIQFLQATYVITIGDDELVPENFETLSAISEFVGRKMPLD